MNSDLKKRLINKAQGLWGQKKHNEIIALLSPHAELMTGVVAYHELMGLAWTELVEHDKAVACFLEAIKLDPLRPLSYTNIGNALAANLKYDEAEKYFKLALVIDEEYFEAIVGLGVISFQKSDYDACQSYFERALKKKPNHLTVLTNLGNTYSVQGKYAEALKCLTRVVKHEPENSLARTNLGLIELGNKDFERGWLDYEYRFDSGNFMAKRFSDIPRWTGTDRRDQTVLIWAEQGLGDEIMFSTIFEDLKLFNTRFVVECDRRLLPSFLISFPWLKLIPRGHPVEDPINCQIPLASLGKLFRKQKNKFKPKLGGHLSLPEVQLPEETIEFLNQLPRPLIGVSWESYALTKNFRNRKSIPAEQFSRLTALHRASFINLQFTNPHKHENQTQYQIPNGVKLIPGIDVKNDVIEIAQIITMCDFVVTVGNSVAHICGAFGKKGLVILPKVADWRWGFSGDESVWYKSLTLVRNENETNWSDVLDRCASHLELSKKI